MKTIFLIYMGLRRIHSFCNLIWFRWMTESQVSGSKGWKLYQCKYKAYEDILRYLDDEIRSLTGGK